MNRFLKWPVNQTDFLCTTDNHSRLTASQLSRPSKSEVARCTLICRSTKLGPPSYKFKFVYTSRYKTIAQIAIG